MVILDRPPGQHIEVDDVHRFRTGQPGAQIFRETAGGDSDLCAGRHWTFGRTTGFDGSAQPRTGLRRATP